jgi:hypothetical protein
MRTARDGALALAAELRAQGGTAAGSLLDAGDDACAGNDEGIGMGAGLDVPGPAQLAAAGPRAAGEERGYELLLEMIHEGSLLHYGAPRVLRDDDADLALLLGDQLYAMGLSRLAEIGDLEAVAELADLISLLAQAQAGGDSELAAAIWRAGATAIGWGAGAEHQAAKALARAGDGQARAALLGAAQEAQLRSASHPGS